MAATKKTTETKPRVKASTKAATKGSIAQTVADDNHSKSVNLFINKVGLGPLQAFQLEQELYNMAIARYNRLKSANPPSWQIPLFCNIYSSLVDRIFNILTVRVPELKDSYDEGRISSQQLCSFKDVELEVETWTSLKCKYASTNTGERIDYRPVTTLYVCRRCQHTRIYYDEVQVRCADEPATLFFECCNCRARWRKD